jgi:hypothetical protein
VAYRCSGAFSEATEAEEARVKAFSFFSLFLLFRFGIFSTLFLVGFERVAQWESKA